MMFSQRYGYVQPPVISIREDLPGQLRLGMLHIARRYLKPDVLHAIASKALAFISNEENRAETDLVNEIADHVRGCPWFAIYDVVEGISDVILNSVGETAARSFTQDLNAFLVQNGVGWQLLEGRFLIRRDEEVETTIQQAEMSLSTAGRHMAAKRIREARQDLSRRPTPDIAGAVSHAIAAVECVLCDIDGITAGKNATLSNFLNRTELFPGSLKTAMSAIWGYACNEGARHGREGVEPGQDEGELVVNVCAAVATYLNRKFPRTST